MKGVLICLFETNIFSIFRTTCSYTFRVSPTRVMSEQSVFDMPEERRQCRSRNEPRCTRCITKVAAIFFCLILDYVGFLFSSHSVNGLVDLALTPCSTPTPRAGVSLSAASAGQWGRWGACRGTSLTLAGTVVCLSVTTCRSRNSGQHLFHIS